MENNWQPLLTFVVTIISIVSTAWLAYFLGFSAGYNRGLRENIDIQIRNHESNSTSET